MTIWQVVGATLLFAVVMLVLGTWATDPPSRWIEPSDDEDRERRIFDAIHGRKR